MLSAAILIFCHFPLFVTGDLLHKLENAEEDIVFLQTDINELKEEKSETEIRLRAELTSLQAEMSAISMFNSYYYSAQILDTFFVLQHIVAFYDI